MRLIEFLRRVVRITLATYFWFRPIAEIVHSHLPVAWRHFYLKVSPQLFLLLFIAYYSLVAESGWLSVAYDLIYVYLWPLVVLWMVVKFTSTKAYRSLKSSRYAQEVIVPQSTPPPK